MDWSWETALVAADSVAVAAVVVFMADSSEGEATATRQASNAAIGNANGQKRVDKSRTLVEELCIRGADIAPRRNACVKGLAIMAIPRWGEVRRPKPTPRSSMHNAHGRSHQRGDAGSITRRCRPIPLYATRKVSSLRARSHAWQRSQRRDEREGCRSCQPSFESRRIRTGTDLYDGVPLARSIWSSGTRQLPS